MSNDEQESNEGPLVRSLSMSRNMAFSVVEEVSHMISLPPPDTPAQVADGRRLWWRSSHTGLKKSSSTSSLIHLRQTQTETVTDSRDKGGKRLPRRGSDGVGGASLDMKSLPATTSQTSRSNANRSVHTSLDAKNFAPLVKGTRRNDLLVGIVVSRWDNIVGPQSVYLWTEELTSVFYPVNLPSPLAKLVKYVTDHTVDHQAATGRYIHPSVQRTTLCIVPDLNLAYLSLSIRVPSELDTILEFQTSAPITENSPDNPALTMPHSISVLYNLTYFTQFLSLRPVVISWLLEFGPQIGVLLCKDNLQSSMINSWCAELCKTITSIQTCWAQDVMDLTISGSTSHRSNSENGDYGNVKTALQRTVDPDISYLPPNTAVIPKLAMGSILTSHLSSFGSSIVVGHDSLLVNQVIRFLLCFSTEEEGFCSRYSLAHLPDTFMKGLFVQGLTLGGIGEKSISHKQVATNRLPLTKVELGSKVKVKQTSITTFTQEKEVLIMQELNKLWTATILAVQSTEAFPNIVKDAAGFVCQFLNELELLPPDRRYGRLLLFRRALHAKAMSLITFLSSIQHKPTKDKMKLKQLIPQILGFDNFEYLIVQVTAEKIRPGVMRLLYPESI